MRRRNNKLSRLGAFANGGKSARGCGRNIARYLSAGASFPYCKEISALGLAQGGVESHDTRQRNPTTHYESPHRQVRKRRGVV